MKSFQTKWVKSVNSRLSCVLPIVEVNNNHHCHWLCVTTTFYSSGTDHWKKGTAQTLNQKWKSILPYICVYINILCVVHVSGEKIATTHRRSNTHCLKGWVATTKCGQAMDRNTFTASFLTKSSSFGFTLGTECHWNANVYIYI